MLRIALVLPVFTLLTDHDDGGFFDLNLGVIAAVFVAVVVAGGLVVGLVGWLSRRWKNRIAFEITGPVSVGGDSAVGNLPLVQFPVEVDLRFSRTIGLMLITAALREADGTGTPSPTVIRIVRVVADGENGGSGVRFNDVRKVRGGRIHLTVDLRRSEAWRGLIRIEVNPVQRPSGGGRDVSLNVGPPKTNEGAGGSGQGDYPTKCRGAGPRSAG